MAIDRVEPPYVADERPMLDAWLEYHRSTLEQKCSSLSAAQLVERSVPPSTMTLLGLVRHMAEVERSWFRRCFAGQADAGPIYYSDDDPDGDFDGVDESTVSDGFGDLAGGVQRGPGDRCGRLVARRPFGRSARR